MVVYGVCYKLQHPVKNGVKGYEKFNITFAYMVSHNEREGFVRLPRTWEFSYQSADGFMVEKLGASETRGLFGGVENQRQKIYSEACERAIGEVLTISLCEILDGQDNEGDVSVIILGPALPKVVGRFASLRPPSNVNIIWVCPNPFPEWIAERANEVLLVPAYPSELSIVNGWEDEALVVGLEYNPAGSASPCVIQRLRIWEMPHDIDLSSYLSTYIWAEAKFATLSSLLKNAKGSKQTRHTRLAKNQRVLLPREISVAAGSVENHLVSQYKGNREEDWRDLPPDFQPDPYVIVSGEALSRHTQPGFHIRWETKKSADS